MLNYLRIIICLMLFSLLKLAAATADSIILVNTMPLKRHSFSEEINVIGQCESSKHKTYRAQTSGTVEMVSTEFGKKLQTGTQLLAIDTAVANATLEEAKSNHNIAESAHQRDQLLLKRKVIAQDVLDKSKANLESAKLQLINARNKHQQMIITAPFEGFLSKCELQAGDEVKAGDYLLDFVGIGKKVINTEFTAGLFNKITPESQGFALINDEKIPAKILNVASHINSQGGVSIALEFPADAPLVVGQYYQIKLLFNQHEALGISQSALLQNDQGPYIYIVDKDNLAQRVQVNVGVINDDLVEINAKQLSIDTQVVTSGLTKLYNKAKVEIQQPETTK